MLPDDAHIRCSGTTHIGITKVKPYGGLHSKRVSRFETREDLLDALVASCHLPFLSNGSLTTQFHGRSVMDGGKLRIGQRGMSIMNTKRQIDIFLHRAHWHPRALLLDVRLRLK
jgi:hypothetical protein